MVLLKARLRLNVFMTVGFQKLIISEYNSTMFKISSQLQSYGDKVIDNDMLK